MKVMRPDNNFPLGRHFSQHFFHCVLARSSHFHRFALGPGPKKVQKRKNFSRHPGGESTSSNYEYLDQSNYEYGQSPAATRWALRFLRLRISSPNQITSTGRAQLQPGGPFGSSGSESPRPIRSRAWALKTRALYMDQSQRAHAHSICGPITEGPRFSNRLFSQNVPTLSISSYFVPTLVMFETTNGRKK